MRVYLAGAWTDRENLGAVMRRIEEMGHTITQDWTTSEVDNIPDRTAEDRIRYARADISGVLEAELVIAVMNIDDYPYNGTRHEIGATQAMKEMSRRLNSACPGLCRPKHLWIVCNGGNPGNLPYEKVPKCMRSLFEYDADRYFETIDEVMEALRL